MGRYDANIETAKQMLAKAEADYAKRAAKPGVPLAVRESILGEAQRRIDEAKWMIETFSKDNR